MKVMIRLIHIFFQTYSFSYNNNAYIPDLIPEGIQMKIYYQTLYVMFISFPYNMYQRRIIFLLLFLMNLLTVEVGRGFVILRTCITRTLCLLASLLFMEGVRAIFKPKLGQKQNKPLRLWLSIQEPILWIKDFPSTYKV